MPSFANADTSFLNQTGGQPVRVVAPATGATVTMRAGERMLCLNHAADIAALTILLPAVDLGERVEILARQVVTTLTLKDSRGTTITGAPTTAAADGTLIAMRFVSTAIGWVPWK